jgi:hypothetical protein
MLVDNQKVQNLWPICMCNEQVLCQFRHLL